MASQIRILYFAWLRDRIGCAEESLTLPEGAHELQDVIKQLRARGGAYEAVFSMGRVVRAAVGQQFAGPETPVSDGDEVAFFPPVTGG